MGGAPASPALASSFWDSAAWAREGMGGWPEAAAGLGLGAAKAGAAAVAAVLAGGAGLKAAAAGGAPPPKLNPLLLAGAGAPKPNAPAPAAGAPKPNAPPLAAAGAPKADAPVPAGPPNPKLGAAAAAAPAPALLAGPPKPKAGAEPGAAGAPKPKEGWEAPPVCWAANPNSGLAADGAPAVTAAAPLAAPHGACSCCFLGAGATGGGAVPLGVSASSSSSSSCRQAKEQAGMKQAHGWQLHGRRVQAMQATLQSSSRSPLAYIGLLDAHGGILPCKHCSSQPGS